MSEHATTRPAVSSSSVDRPTFANVFGSELTKIVSVRSFRWILLAVPVVAALTSIVCGTTLPQTTERTLDQYTPIEQLNAFLYGGYAVTILMFVFAAIVVGSEYSTKTASTTLIITPRRGRVFWAKVAVQAAVGWAAGLIAVAVCVLVGTAVTGGSMNIIGNGLLRNAFWFSLQPAFYSVLAALVVLVRRSTAWGISVSILVFGVLPAFLNAMPSGVEASLKPLTPVAALHSIAGSSVPGSTEDVGVLGGIAVLAVWTIVFVLWAWRRVSRDDA